MEAKGVNMIHMNGGNDDISYANNSSLQKFGISKTMDILDEALRDMLSSYGRYPKCFKMADLGCASGPNTLSVVSHIIDTIEGSRKQKVNTCDHDGLVEFEVFLNDLPGNDFNNLFKMLPSFYQKLNENKGTENRCFVSGVPGSFYGRLFPSKSLNFVYSSFSLQWLSKVPNGLENNKKHIHMAIESPPEVFEAYAKHYRKDFYTFLSSRGEEMTSGGRMILTFGGRSMADPFKKDDLKHFALLAETLTDLIDEGLIQEADLHSFNVPVYTPCKEEIEATIQSEGSFNLDRIEHFLVPWNADVRNGDNVLLDKHKKKEMVTKFFRAFTEPVLVSHFGSSIMDELYERYGNKLCEHLADEDSSFFNMVVSLRKK